MTFTVIDKKTGEYPDTRKIALREKWANSLVYCDIEGFALQEDGTLILLDECGNVAYCPPDRFEVRFDNENPWHTGTPTEDGCYYAIICKGWERPYNRLALVKDGKIYCLDDAGDCEDFPHEIVKYREVWRFKGN